VLIGLKILLRELLLPPAGPLLLGLLGAALWRWRPRLAWTLVVTALASLWVLATPRVGCALYRLTEAYPALDPRAPVAAEAIVILGGGGSRTDSPEWDGATMRDAGWDRIAYGAWLARRTALPVLITSYAADATAMRDTLRRAFAVDARWVDAEARDTHENARHAARLLATGTRVRVVLVTHSNHMGRAVEEFVAEGFEVVPAPVLVNPTAPPGLAGWLPQAGALALSGLGLYELIGRPVSSLLRRARVARGPG
jgi:uncharacterized SAM-binding protein YcdF (DUF218 family)